MNRRLALIIGSSEYKDAKFSRLVAPTADICGLSKILQNPNVGNFNEVLVLENEPVVTVLRAIAYFYAQKKHDDLLLMYFSGHGLRDDRGDLYLACGDTEYDLLSVTAIPATFITHEMDGSNSRRQILILDCCHSGSFAQGAKCALGVRVGTATAFKGAGSGRTIFDGN